MEFVLVKFGRLQILKSVRTQFAYRLQLIILCILFIACLLSTTSIQAKPQSNPALKHLQVMAKFPNKASAEKLLDSLKKNGQNVRILEQKKEITLKTLSLGLYPGESEAEAVVKHLKKNHIDAYLYEQKNGLFRVYAGAMEDEEHYWSRFEKLLSLGYQRIHTTLKPQQISEFLIVRDKNEELPTPYDFKPLRVELKQERLITSLHRARFKGEFDFWGTPADRRSGNFFSTTLIARTKYGPKWDYTYGFRFDATEQSAEENVQKFEFQPGPFYLRLREPNQLWSIGLLYANWDDRNRESLSDRMSSRNLVRYKLDKDVVDRRRPVYGLRWEHMEAEYKLDVIISPIFRPAKLPDFNSIWHPVRQSSGKILGIKSPETLQELVKKGSFADSELSLTGNIGVRMSKQVGSRTRGITFQYARFSQPYFQLNPKVRKLLNSGESVSSALADVSGKTFFAKHPYSGIFTWEEFNDTSQFEIALLSESPYTTTDYQMKTAMAIEWRMGFKYPIKNDHVEILSFFNGRVINTEDAMLDRKTKLSISGDIYRLSENQYWRFGTSYEIGLDKLALYLNPSLTFKQSKHISLNLNYHLFSGADGTEEGYHTTHSLISLNWTANF